MAMVFIVVRVRTAWRAAGLFVAFVVASAATLFARIIFLVFSCGAIDDTGGPFPAQDSAQGRLCAPANDDIVVPHGIAAWTITLAGLVAVLLLVAAWRRRNQLARILGVVGLVGLPMLVLIPLSVPADTCTRDMRHTRGSDCATSN